MSMPDVRSESLLVMLLRADAHEPKSSSLSCWALMRVRVRNEIAGQSRREVVHNAHSLHDYVLSLQSNRKINHGNQNASCNRLDLLEKTHFVGAGLSDRHGIHVRWHPC